MAAVIAYWPAVVAGLYLLYILAAGKFDQVQPAIAALLAAFGLVHTGLKVNAVHRLMFSKPAVRPAFRPRFSAEE